MESLLLVWKNSFIHLINLCWWKMHLAASQEGSLSLWMVIQWSGHLHSLVEPLRTICSKDIFQIAFMKNTQLYSRIPLSNLLSLKWTGMIQALKACKLYYINMNSLSESSVWPPYLPLSEPSKRHYFWPSDWRILSERQEGWNSFPVSN